MLQKLLISVPDFFAWEHHNRNTLFVVLGYFEFKLFVMWNEFTCFQNQNHNSNRCVKKRNSYCFTICIICGDLFLVAIGIFRPFWFQVPKYVSSHKNTHSFLQQTTEWWLRMFYILVQYFVMPLSLQTSVCKVHTLFALECAQPQTDGNMVVQAAVTLWMRVWQHWKQRFLDINSFYFCEITYRSAPLRVCLEWLILHVFVARVWQEEDDEDEEASGLHVMLHIYLRLKSLSL